MTTNHQAQGPVSLDRLHQISEILSKSAAQSDGGNLGYAMADAVKVINAATAAFRDDKETTHNSIIAEQLAHILSSLDVNDHQRAIITCSVDRLNKNAEILQQAPYSLHVPEKLDYQGAKELFNYLMTEEETNATVNGWNACRAAMLQGGNSPVTPDGYVLVPKKLTAENGAKGVLSGEFSETKFINCPECFGDDDCETCDGSGRIEITVPVTWTTIKAIWAKGVEHFEAAPQQEVK
ncbi:hypothetical protein ACBQ88_22360 [Citrobacter braakii]|uniref:hypothetical protein n=1 Tax=Citrobacter braakii TaxID=57706 RepID=UPI003524E9E3